MKYNVYSKVVIADMPNIDSSTICEMISELVSDSTGELITKIEPSVNISEAYNDNDVVAIELVVTTSELKYSDATERLVRREMSNKITKLFEDSIESVAYKILTFIVTKG